MLNFDLDIDFDEGFSSTIFGKCLSNDSKKPDQTKPEKVIFQESSDTDLFGEDFEIEEPPKCDNFFENFRREKNVNSFPDSSSDNNVQLKKSSGSNEVVSMKRSSFNGNSPQKKRISHGRLVERKFPGPAGILPDIPFTKDTKDMLLLADKSLEEENKEPGKSELVIYSQSSGSVFLELTYQKAMEDFDLNDSESPLSKYTVDWVKKSAAKKALQGRKIPFLVVVLHNINHKSPDPVLILRDPTGEIHGTLHREVWGNLGAKLRVGITLTLKQVGVLITGVIRRQIYLNITLNNILSVYSPSETSSEKVDILTVNKLSKQELLKSCEEWKLQGVQVPGKRSPPSLFSTIEQQNCNKDDNVLNTPVYKPPSKVTEQMTPKKENKNGNQREILSDLGILLTDGDFNDVMDLPGNKPEAHKPEVINFKPKYRIDIQENRPVFVNVNGEKESEPEKERKEKSKNESQSSWKEESLILEEVLSGVDLNEFEF